MKNIPLQYDVVVIGAGPAGYSSAIRLAQNGKKVACIEARNLGGECLNHGCIPSKAFLQAAKTYHAMGNASTFGVNIEGRSFDINAFQVWKNKRIVKKLSAGIGYLFKTKGVDFMKGKAFFIDKNSIQIMTQEGMKGIRTKNVVIAAGTKSRILPGLEPDGKRIFGPREILDIDFVPETVTILGGGYIGFEIGFAFLLLGKKVSIVENMSSVLAGLDDDLREAIEISFKNLGGTIYTSAEFKSFQETTFAFKDEEGEKEVETEVLLVAAGREWDFTSLRLGKIEALKFNANGSIKTDERMETTLSGIFAIGDCTGGTLLAHKAVEEGLLAADSICNPTKKPASRNSVPFAVFTEPEVAATGLTEKEAKEKRIPYTIGHVPSSAIGINSIIGEKTGYIKILVDPTSNVILGGKIVGKNASNLIAEISLAVDKKLTAQDLSRVIHVHPSQSEIITEAVESIFKRSIHF